MTNETMDHSRHSAGWPTQLRLQGQAAAPEGPVDPYMMYVVHHAFRRDLDRFLEAARRTPADDRATWRRLARRWELFAVVLHQHHAGEDAGLWPWLRARVTPEDLQVLDAMEAEHEEIDPALDACAAGFSRLADAADEGARAALVVRLVGARDGLARHLAHEETDAMRILQEVATQAEWRALEVEHFQGGKLPLRLVARLVPWVALGLPGEVRGRVLADGGALLRALWVLGHRRFERAEARTFRYVA